MLSEAQLELLIDLTEEYLTNTDDLSQVEWALAKSTVDVLQEALEEQDES